MNFSPDKLFNNLGIGILFVGSRQLVEGMFETFCKKLTIKEVQEWILDDKSIWQNITPEWRVQLLRYGKKMDLQFIDVEWAMKICLKVNPGLASLFMNWPEAIIWLQANLDNLRANILGTVKL